MSYIEEIKVDISGSGHITNCYLVYDETGRALLVDPGDEADKIIHRIKEFNVVVEKILITHGHADHLGALEKLQMFTKASILVHVNDVPEVLNEVENYCELLGVMPQHISKECIVPLKDQDTFTIGEMEFEVIHTPGHTSGCICVYEKTSKRLLTGDTLFADCYGRCDLYSGDFDQMVSSIKKLFSRFEDVMMYPGHDAIVNIDSCKRKIRMLLAYKGVHI